jgi:hypothetical protein
MKTPAEELFPDLYSPAPPPADLAAGGGRMSEVGPGVWTTGMPEFETPSHILCRLVPLSEPGTYRLEPEPYPGYVRMQEGIGRKLGLLGLSDTTMRRLITGGFVEHARPAVGMILISIESLLSHLRRTANDCAQDKSWWTPKRRALWRSVIDGGTNLEDGY